MRSPAVSADVLGLGVRDELVGVGTIVSEDTGAAVTTGIYAQVHIMQRWENHRIRTMYIRMRH